MTSCFRLRESAAYVDAKTSNTTEPKDGNADNGVRCAQSSSGLSRSAIDEYSCLHFSVWVSTPCESPRPSRAKALQGPFGLFESVRCARVCSDIGGESAGTPRSPSPTPPWGVFALKRSTMVPSSFIVATPMDSSWFAPLPGLRALSGESRGCGHWTRPAWEPRKEAGTSFVVASHADRSVRTWHFMPPPSPRGGWAGRVGSPRAFDRNVRKWYHVRKRYQ